MHLLERYIWPQRTRSWNLLSAVPAYVWACADRTGDPPIDLETVTIHFQRKARARRHEAYKFGRD